MRLSLSAARNSGGTEAGSDQITQQMGETQPISTGTMSGSRQARLMWRQQDMGEPYRLPRGDGSTQGCCQRRERLSEELKTIIEASSVISEDLSLARRLWPRKHRLYGFETKVIGSSCPMKAL